MEDSVLWVVAIGSGALGLLLLAVAGVVVVYWNTIAHRPKGIASADRTQSHTGSVTPAGKKRQPANAPAAQPATAKSPWLWIKAWFFAFLHAGTVSVVLGGITFFEDLARASDEIQRTGTVTFPKQLLPGTLSGPASRRRLSRPSGDSDLSGTEGETEVNGLDQTAASPDSAGWEVVDLVSEVGTRSG